MASEVENIYIKVGVDTTQFNSSMQGIKKEIQLLNSTKFNMNVFTKEQALAIQTRIGDLKGQMEDLRIAQSSLDKGDVFGNMARLGGVAANAVGAVAGGMSLLGVKSEEVGKIETKVMTAIALGNTLQQLADAKRLKNIVLEYAADVKSLAMKGAKLVADKLSFDMTNKQTVAEIAGNRAKTIGAVATQAITKAQWAWNAAMAANPVGIIIAGIVALVAAIYLLTKAFGKSTETAKEYEKSIDGVVIKDEKLRESHNADVKLLKDLDIQYRVLTGSLSEYGAEIETLYNTMAEESYKAKNQMIKDLEDVGSGILSWRNLFDSSIFSWIKRISEGNKLLESIFPGIKDANEKKRKIQEDFDKSELEKKKIIEDSKKLIIERSNQKVLQGEIDTQQKIIDYRVSRLKDTISLLSSEYNAHRQSTEKILSLYKSLADKQEELRNRGITPEEKELQQVDKYFNSYITDIEEINRQLEIEKTNRNDIAEQIKSNEELLQQYKGAEKSVGVSIQESKKLIQERIGLVQSEIDIRQKEIDNTIVKSVQIRDINGKIVENRILDTEAEAKKNKLIAINNQERGNILTLQQQSIQLDIDALNAQQERKAIEKQLSDLSKDKIKNQKEINRLEGEIKKLPVISEVDEAAITERVEKEKKLIREKYSRERQQSISEDNLAINQIEIKGQQSIIDNEKLSDKERKEALYKRNELLKQSITLNEQLLTLKVLEVQAQINVLKAITTTNDVERKSLDEQILVLESKIKLLEKSTEATNKESEAIINTTVELKKQYTELEMMFNGIFDHWNKLKPEDKVIGILELAQKTAQVFSDYVSTITSGLAAKSQREMDNALKIMSDANDAYMKGLDNSLKYGIINQETYNKEKLKIEKEYTAKEKELKQEQARKEKEYSIWQAVAGTANAVINGLQTQPFVPLGIIMGTLAAALGAVQIGFIKNTPLPEFALGGMIQGQSHTAGGVPLMAEGGEFIVKKSVSQRPGMGDFLNRVNSGQVTNNNYNTNGIDMDTMTQIIKETVNSITAIPVINVESNSTSVQRKVSNIEQKSRW